MLKREIGQGRGVFLESLSTSSLILLPSVIYEPPVEPGGPVGLNEARASVQRISRLFPCLSLNNFMYVCFVFTTSLENLRGQESMLYTSPCSPEL